MKCITLQYIKWEVISTKNKNQSSAMVSNKAKMKLKIALYLNTMEAKSRREKSVMKNVHIWS